MRAVIVLAQVVGLLAFAAPAGAEIVHFRADLTGAAETPPKDTAGKGTAEATLDTRSRTLTWRVTYSGLSGPATMAHFHGPAAPGVSAGVTAPLGPPVTSPITGSAKLQDGQIGDLRGGLWYVNVHTAKYPGGEIRGQLLTAP